MTIENIRNCMEGGDYFGKSKEELENKIKEIENWINSNVMQGNKNIRIK